MDIRHETLYGIFEWDSGKNDINLHKHKIDFYAAVEVFTDEHAIFSHDALHSGDEERFKIIGRISGFRIAAVFFTDRQGITRIISARKATKNETGQYERNFKN